MRETIKKGALFIGMLLVLASTYRAVGELTLERGVGISYLTALDSAMPLIPELTVVYMTIYFMWLPLVFSPNISYGYFRRTVYATYLTFLVLYAFYFIAPASYPRPELGACDCLRHAPLKFLYSIDLPNNTFPSSHAAGVAILLVAAVGKLRPRALFLYRLWGTAILFSTFAIKQHHIIDTLTGALLGALIYKAYARYRPLPTPTI